MRLIPGKTKVQIELFKGVSLADVLVGAVTIVLLILIFLSSLPLRLYIALAVLLVAALLLARLDTVPNYVYLLHILRHLSYPTRFERVTDDRRLRQKKSMNKKELAFHAVFDEEPEVVPKKPSREAEKARKAERKREDRLLKSKSVPQEEKDAIWKKRAEESAASAQRMADAKDAAAKRRDMEEIIAFTGIANNVIDYDGEYYGAVFEIPPVEFRFFSEYRRNMSIEGGLGRVLRGINPNYSANIVKIDRPYDYDAYLAKEYSKEGELRTAFEKCLISEAEFQARLEIVYDRIYDLRSLCVDSKIIVPFYYLVLFDSDRRQLENTAQNALNLLQAGEMEAHRLNDKELAVFLKYTNQLDFDEKEIDSIEPGDYAAWAMPDVVDIKGRTVEVNHIITHNMCVVNYPMVADDAWLATVMSIPGTKCVVKARPMDRGKAIRGIDRSLQELRGQYMMTNVDSKRMELQSHIDTLGELLVTLQQANENLLEVNIYVTAYDIVATRANTRIKQPGDSMRPNAANMKKSVRRTWQENGFRLNNMEFDQEHAFIGSQVSGYDPMAKNGRGIPSNSLAACYPWVFAHVSDEGGIHLGSSDGVPVFIDFFRRDSERVNSNMVIVGKSGSGKSYATKSLLTNLAADDSKIFILDPENEYSELAENLHGKFINVGNAQYGRLNPFHIITALDDDETDGSTVSGSYATHLQFLEEFFRQILPDCDKDAMEYLNTIIDRMYTNHGITAETDLSKLKPEDYPIFDDLYDAILAEFQSTDNAYIRTILRTLMNYIAKFSTGGRNANIWNGPSTVTTEENFIVFNFQSLLANRNGTIANAQMLLVLKYIDNEIIKNRDYNTKYGLHRKVVVAIDEAHVFIDSKFPVALDFMFQLAKRIRKYNGMQIVITQNIKDFVGSEEIARKSTAIINACQYSFIFSLAPNDMSDLCTLYEKAGGISDIEQDQIVTAPRGQAFTVMSPTSRSTFQVEVPDTVVDLFQNREFTSHYFSGPTGAAEWERIIGDSRNIRIANGVEELIEQEETYTAPAESHVTFEETTEDEPLDTGSTVFFEETEDEPPKAAPQSVQFEETADEPAEPPKPAPQEDSSLTGLLEKFSYDAIVHEIRRAVREELDQSGVPASETPAAPESKPVLQPVPEPIPQPVPEPEVIPEPEVTMPAPAPEVIPEPESTVPETAAEPAPILPVEETAAEPAQPAETEPAAVSLGSIFDAVTEKPAASPEPAPQPERSADELEMQSLLAAIGVEEEETEPAAETDDTFDIMSLLVGQAEEMASVSPIDLMVSYGESTTEITLEELAQYNAQRRKIS